MSATMSAATSTPAPDAPLRARHAWILVPLAIAVASRLYSGLLILALNELRRKPVANPYGLWDGEWYERIVDNGYHGFPVDFHPALGIPWHDFAFFPGWPFAIKLANTLAAPLDLRPLTVAAVLANLLFLPALVLAWRVIADRLGPRAATAGVALLAFAPSAYAFSMTYSESLFVLFAAASLLPVRSALLRGPLTAAAVFTRVTGLPLVLTAFVTAVQTRGRERRAAIAAVLGGTLAFGIWYAWVSWLTGSLTGFSRGSASWNLNSGLVPQLTRVFAEPSWEQTGWVLFTLVAAVAAVMLVRRNAELGIFSLACLALLVLPGSVTHSWPRYILAAFPIFAALGDRVHERFGGRALVALVVVFALLQALFAGWTIPSTLIAP